jgi:hypothetical protein
VPFKKGCQHISNFVKYGNGIARGRFPQYCELVEIFVSVVKMHIGLMMLGRLKYMQLRLLLLRLKWVLKCCKAIDHQVLIKLWQNWYKWEVKTYILISGNVNVFVIRKKSVVVPVFTKKKK